MRTLARWTTDRDVGPRRFSTAFLIARLPEGQTPVADDAEQFEPVWLRAELALQRHQQGSLPLIFPTLRTLQWLARFDDIQVIGEPEIVQSNFVRGYSKMMVKLSRRTG